MTNATQSAPPESEEKERAEQELRDFRKKITTESLNGQHKRALMATTGIPDINRYNLTPLSDLLNEPAEDTAFLWDKTLSTGGISIMVAKPKAGKSTLGRNLALAVAKGAPAFLGRSIKATGPVVYLALEEKRSEVKKHFERMGANENLPILIHTGSAPEKAIDELRTAILESKAILAIVDPLQRLIRLKDLNDYSSVSLALEPLMQIARETGCHILLIHHANKGISKEGGDSILGSTAIFGSVDCALIMKRGEEYRTIESIQRYGEDLPRTVLTFDVATGLTNSGGSLEDAQVNECGKSIIEIMDGHELTEKEIKEGITDHKGGIVSKSLRMLCQEGIIQRQGFGKKGGPFTYSMTNKNARDTGNTYTQIPTIPTKPITDFSYENANMQGITGLSNNAKPNPQHFTHASQPEESPLDSDEIIEGIIGMPAVEALDIYVAHGKPLIHISAGVDCGNMQLFLSTLTVRPTEQVEAMKNWLKEHRQSGKET